MLKPSDLKSVLHGQFADGLDCMQAALSALLDAGPEIEELKDFFRSKSRTSLQGGDLEQYFILSSSGRPADSLEILRLVYDLPRDWWDDQPFLVLAAAQAVRLSVLHPLFVSRRGPLWMQRFAN